jgi:hypothetical protein
MNELRLREIHGVWRWEVIGRTGKQLTKGPGWVTRELAEENPWNPRMMTCPVHGITMPLNLAGIPVCPRDSGCEFGP